MKNIVSICTQKKGCTLKDHVKGKLKKKKLQKQSSLKSGLKEYQRYLWGYNSDKA